MERKHCHMQSNYYYVFHFKWVGKKRETNVYIERQILLIWLLVGVPAHYTFKINHGWGNIIATYIKQKDNVSSIRL